VKNIGYIIVGLFLWSCGSVEETDIPVEILKKEDFIPVVVDLQILEAHFQRQFSRSDLYRDALDSSSALIFEDHGITKEIFSNSLDYYVATPDTLFTIYEAALDSIKFRINNLSGQNSDSTVLQLNP